MTTYSNKNNMSSMVKNLFVSATVVATVCQAAPTVSAPASALAPSASTPKMPANQIHAFALQSWGPQEKTDEGQAVFVDPGMVDAAYIHNINAQGKKTVCYIDAGTLEDWRQDREAFITDSHDDFGKKYKGYGGTETWLDISHWQSYTVPMSARIQAAASKGCTAIELDNTDCYENACVSGASYDSMLAWEKEWVAWLVETVHSHGMAVGLKNSQELIPQFLNDFEFAINEQCMDYNECGLYKPFVDQNKVVFNVEYNNHNGKVCQESAEYHLVTKYANNGVWANCF